MDMCKKGRPRRLRAIVVFVCAGLVATCGVKAQTAQSTQQPATNPATRPVGTIKSIVGKTIVLTTDAGTEVTVQVQDDAKLVRVEPGEKDLKNAAPLQLQDLQAGDRILVRGKMADDGKTVLGASIIAIKSVDIAAKQAHERDEWQRHGVGGLVKAVDSASGSITISTNATGVAKDVTVQTSKQTVLRRYAPNSVKFDDAKPAPMDQIKVGRSAARAGYTQPGWRATDGGRSCLRNISQYSGDRQLDRCSGWNDYCDGSRGEETYHRKSYGGNATSQTESSYCAGNCDAPQRRFRGCANGSHRGHHFNERTRQSPRTGQPVARLVVKRAKLAVQEAQDGQVELREAGEAAI